MGLGAWGNKLGNAFKVTAANVAAALGYVPVNPTWTVVESAAVSVSPTAADSGTYYRLTTIGATFNLPTTALVVGKTEFFVTFADGLGGNSGIIEAGAGKTIDAQATDWGSGNAVQTITGVITYRLIHIKYVATNKWASNVLWA